MKISSRKIIEESLKMYGVNSEKQLCPEIVGEVVKFQDYTNKIHNIDYKKLESYAVRYALEKGLFCNMGSKEVFDNIDIGMGSAKHLKGIYDLSYVLGLEDNSLINSGWGFCYLGEEKKVSNEIKSDRYLQVAQFIGFMNSIENHWKNSEGDSFPLEVLDSKYDKEENKYNWKPLYPALYSINNRARSGRGHNSPATGKFIHEYNAVRYKLNNGNKSPGKLERSIWACKRKANNKHNINIKFEEALEAIGIVGISSASKSATVAASIKIAGYKIYNNYENSNKASYRGARDLLIQYLSAKSNNNIQDIDGVETLIGNNIDKKGHIDLYEAWWKEEGKNIYGYLFLTQDGDSYHLSKRSNNSIKLYWEEGIDALKKRKIDKINNVDILNVINGKLGFNTLINIQDSYDVGNCKVGTANWMKENGIFNKKLIHIKEVYNLALESNNTLVMNVVKNVVNGVLGKVGRE